MEEGACRERSEPWRCWGRELEGGRCILSRGRRGRGLLCGHARAARRRRGLDWVMSPSARKVMLHSNVIGELEELAVLVAVSTRKPAWVGCKIRPLGMQRMTSSAEMSE